jgi:ATP-dependent helicase YprA (DUF1998 family)
METVLSTHQKLRKELAGYLKSQYIGRNNLLLSALEGELEKEGVLWRTPYVELPMEYERAKGGLDGLDAPAWLKDFFHRLVEHRLGVFKTPFDHQIKALQNVIDGRDLFVSTGTGSGKTECFMWPLIARLCSEARNFPGMWNTRGVRAIVMYPMNALVSDQIGRLRRIIGTDKFIEIFRSSTTVNSRRPQFGMYTGRTPYAGKEPDSKYDGELINSLSRLLPNENLSEELYQRLLDEGKIPAKADLKAFFAKLYSGKHTPDPDDAELITRFEMQNVCPDILITNYSMLEYMLFRPREKKIWESTAKWLGENNGNKLLFVIDEAHMYRGAAGGEVALLIRRLFNKLGVSRERVQFILTTASMPHESGEDGKAVSDFARGLTSDKRDNFVYLYGQTVKPDTAVSKSIDAGRLLSWKEPDGEDEALKALNIFWNGYAPAFDEPAQAKEWLYDNIMEYDLFCRLDSLCRGSACSTEEIAKTLFPGLSKSDAATACNNALSVAAMAVSAKGEARLPLRLHMIFRGLRGVYACSNPRCGDSRTHDGVTVGRIFLDDRKHACDRCGGMVYELINDRRCGALFIKGYVTRLKGKTFLWRHPGQYAGSAMYEIHLFIPHKDKKYGKDGDNPVEYCYLDSQSGFLYFSDQGDDINGHDGVIKLYYRNCKEGKSRPPVLTFATCPHCQRQLGGRRLTTFSTKGNESFYNLIKAQFDAQPPVPLKSDRRKYPNQGRKVLLFSDSRQRAARLARDMSRASDELAVTQLFMLAVRAAEQSGEELNLNGLYGYFVKEAALRDLRLFHNEEDGEHGSRQTFFDHCREIREKIDRRERSGRPFVPKLTFDQAPDMAKEHLIRLFCAAYNNLYDHALAWLEPAEEALEEAIDSLKAKGINVSEEDFIAFFNAWAMEALSKYGALGSRNDDKCRREVLTSYKRLGLEREWTFSDNLLGIMGWTKNDPKTIMWKNVLHSEFLDGSEDRYYIQLSKVTVRDGLPHKWKRCGDCMELTAFGLNGKCPGCGSGAVYELTGQEYSAMGFWRGPIAGVRDGGEIHVINTEEHTAQLSHIDQRDDVWSRTEKYEMRFQDLLHGDENPVDILSCTTTMEVGIDIGSLTAIGLRNVPPMRENYQQRAGRAGRRGTGLSTIVTYCDNGAHDSIYFDNPAPMFRGSPRRPWIDVDNEKLLMRHMSIIIMQKFLQAGGESLDDVKTIAFFDEKFERLAAFIEQFDDYKNGILLYECKDDFIVRHKQKLTDSLKDLDVKRTAHPELFKRGASYMEKSLLDALCEEAIIPTYSFPRNGVSLYVNGVRGKLEYSVDRGLDIAISEYAPGRSVVIDKKTYQIGGFYCAGTERQRTPAKAFVNDENYVKAIYLCEKCGWFGLTDDRYGEKCPLCGSAPKPDKPMIRPWGFGPVNGKPTPEARLSEVYTFAEAPEYSALPDSDDLKTISKFAKVAKRQNQRVIMRNSGDGGKGFIVCPDCGAAIPGNDVKKFSGDKDGKIGQPFQHDDRYSCTHRNADAATHNYSIGFDFVTDMQVIEITLDKKSINTSRRENPWVDRAARSLSEALRLQASRMLDIEFTELNAGYRLREKGESVFVDIYLYDNLSSGAGYSSGVAQQIYSLLSETEIFLNNCGCDNACHDCIKHYRNQNYHSALDRHAALDLLAWAKDGRLSEEISAEEQKKLMDPLKRVLSDYGITLSDSDGGRMVVTKSGKKYNLRVYPAMYVKPDLPGTVFVSDFEAKYSRAYAVESIRGAF